MTSKVHGKWLGLIDIEEGFNHQNQALACNSEDTVEVLGCEHHEVLSVGKSLWNQDIDLHLKGFKQIHKTQRGGKLTLHNPGQLIIYPILNLKSMGLTLKDYVCLIVKTSSQTLMEFGLVSQCETKEQIGVYCGNKKIVSIGLHFKRGWVSHGLSINVSNELKKFNGFEICGHKEMQVTSFANEGVMASTEEVFKVWMRYFTANLMDHNPTVLKHFVEKFNSQPENFRNFN